MDQRPESAEPVSDRGGLCDLSAVPYTPYVAGGYQMAPGGSSAGCIFRAAFSHFVVVIHIDQTSACVYCLFGYICK